jgi:hypothetical protein
MNGLAWSLSPLRPIEDGGGRSPKPVADDSRSGTSDHAQDALLLPEAGVTPALARTRRGSSG